MQCIRCNEFIRDQILEKMQFLWNWLRSIRRKNNTYFVKRSPDDDKSIIEIIKSTSWFYGISSNIISQCRTFVYPIHAEHEIDKIKIPIQMADRPQLTFIAISIQIYILLLFVCKKKKKVLKKPWIGYASTSPIFTIIEFLLFLQWNRPMYSCIITFISIVIIIILPQITFFQFEQKKLYFLLLFNFLPNSFQYY